MLELLGCVATAAESGEEAVELYRQKPADVVILDVDLPGFDGAEAYRRLRDIEPGCRVVFSSGQRNVSRISEFLSAPTVKFLEKPYTLSELLAAFRAVGLNTRE